ncbi:unnamed protein product [Tilletia controversa]|nr:unnamed protein product [Tilletia controversa]
MISPGYAEVFLTDADGRRLTELYPQGLLSQEQLEEAVKIPENGILPTSTCYIEAVAGMTFRIRVQELVKRSLKRKNRMSIEVELDEKTYLMYKCVYEESQDSANRTTFDICQLIDEDGHDRDMPGEISDVRQEPNDEAFIFDDFKTGEVLVTLVEIERERQRKEVDRRKKALSSQKKGEGSRSDTVKQADIDTDSTATNALREGEGSSNDKRKASSSEIVVPEEYLEKAKRRRLDAGLAPLPEETRSGPEAASGTSNSDDEGTDEDTASSHGPAASISAASATAAPAPPSAPEASTSAAAAAPEASTSASVSATAASTVEGTLPQAGAQEPVGGVKREETGITLEVKKEILNGDNAIGNPVEVQEARRELQAAIERLDRALSGGTRNAQVKDEVEDIKPNLALGGNSTADPIEID